tara:strand:+ start:340 stop:552 length:213 start_codon:yes stop_codon:yes gene_type:complete
MSKIYWWLVDISMYLVLLLFFLLVLLGIYFKTMIDKFCYKLFGTLDNICEWIANKIAGKRCKCKKGVKDD